jgi:DNA-binding transcriptional LysR family regulator
MEPRYLRQFLAVADSGSITKAAERLGIAQPVLSQSLTRLENRAGVKFFKRTRSGVSLTPAGAALIQDVRSVLANIDRLELRVKEIAKGCAGSIVVGLVSSALVEVLPRALRLLKREAPDVQVVLKEMSNAELELGVRLGTIDIALMHPPVCLTKDMSEKTLVRDRLIAAVPTQTLLEQENYISCEEIARSGLVMFPHTSLPLFNNQILDVFRQRGISVSMIQEVNRTFTALACVSGGLGVALLPAWIRALSLNGVRYCEIENAGFPSFDLSAIWLKSNKRSLANLFYESITYEHNAFEAKK